MNLEMFKNGKFEVRGGDIDGTPYFVAKDVAETLGYTDAEAMTRRLDEDEKQNLQIVGFGNRGVTVINESGLYNAIFGSKKDEAKLFKKWVTSEILPSIRKNGAYIDQELKEAINTFIPKSGFLEPNKNDELKTKPIRGYYRVDKTSEEAKLLTRRYQLQKRLNSLFIEDIKIELAEIDMNLSELRQLTA